MAVTSQQVLVTSPYRSCHELISHRSAIDEQVLLARGRAMQGWQAGVTGKSDPLSRGVYGQRVISEIMSD